MPRPWTRAKGRSCTSCSWARCAGAGRLTTSGSLPAWLADRWLERLGPETAVARARALAEEPPTFFRANPRVADALARAEAAGLAPRPAAVPGAWEAATGRIADLARDGVLYP